MLRNKIALTIGIMLIIGIFFAIIPQSAHAFPPLSVAWLDLNLNKADAIKRATAVFSTAKMKVNRQTDFIFGNTANDNCAIIIHSMGGNKSIAFIAVTINNEQRAKEMRDSIYNTLKSGIFE